MSTLSSIWAKLTNDTDQAPRRHRVPPARDRAVLDPIARLEWSLVHGQALRTDHSTWESPARSADPVGSYESFRAGGVFAHSASDLVAVFQGFADRHVPVYRHGREELFGRLRSLGPKGFLCVREGLALSHPRTPIIFPVREPTITVCLADEPVPLGERELTFARCFFLLICPQVSAHLSLLARLSRLLATDRFVALLDGQHSFEEIMDFVWLFDCGLEEEEINIPVKFSR